MTAAEELVHAMAGKGWNRPCRCIDFVHGRGAQLRDLLAAVEAVCSGDQFGPLHEANLDALHRAHIAVSLPPPISEENPCES